jgi:hypothetical protein
MRKPVQPPEPGNAKSLAVSATIAVVPGQGWGSLDDTGPDAEPSARSQKPGVDSGRLPTGAEWKGIKPQDEVV